MHDSVSCWWVSFLRVERERSSNVVQNLGEKERWLDWIFTKFSCVVSPPLNLQESVAPVFKVF